MINIELNEAKGIAVVRPDSSRGLAEDDFRAIAAVIDPYVINHGRLNGLVIQTEHFPGWEDMRAFISHIRFVRDHHRKIKRVALISDGRFTSAAPLIADHFVAAEIKHFSASEMKAAEKWVAADVV